MKFIDKAITNLEGGNRNIHEKASSPEIRAKKHAEAQAKGSKTDKSKKTMSKFVRRALGKKYTENPEAVRSNERALAAGRRFVRGERYNQPSSVAESFVYAFNMWSFMLAENQFASRPGGDGSGEKKAKEAKRRAFINTKNKIKQGQRERMASNETIKRRIAARKEMDDKIRKMMGLDK